MTMRIGGGVYEFGRRPSIRPNYENFKPKSEWKDQHGALLLLLHLPGFIKEQIRFTKEVSTSSIRVYGERGVLPNRRRIRFNTSFTIPKDCNLNQVNTMFENGILTITIPKITTTQNYKEETHKQGQDTKDIETLNLQEAIPQKGQNEIDKRNDKSVGDKKSVIDNKEKMFEANGSPIQEVEKPLVKQMGELGDGNKGKAKEEVSKGSISEKGQNDEGVRDQKIIDHNKEKMFEANGSPIQVEKPLAKQMVKLGDDGDKEKAKEDFSKGSISEKGQNDESVIGDQKVIDHNKEKMFETNRNPVEVEKSLMKEEVISTQKSMPKEGVSKNAMDVEKENASALGDKPVKEIGEERQLLVNTFIAILVIVTLGAYIWKSVEIN